MKRRLAPFRIRFSGERIGCVSFSSTKRKKYTFSIAIVALEYSLSFSLSNERWRKTIEREIKLTDIGWSCTKHEDVAWPIYQRGSLEK